MKMTEEPDPKPVLWIGSSRDDLKEFPEGVQKGVGHALWVAQCGEKYMSAKPLKGFGGASILEVVENHDGDTYRAVYTVRFAEVVFVLHCFQKKSKHGIETPKAEIELINSRLKWAKEIYEELKSGGEL